MREGLGGLRFTDPEVSAAPSACAKEIDGLLCRTARETLELYWESGRVGELVIGDARSSGARPWV
jgi:hypothetical protein